MSIPRATYGPTRAHLAAPRILVRVVRRAALALVLVAACKSDAPPPASPPPRRDAGAAILAAPIDATPAPDAEQFALFDHLAVRKVTRPTPPHPVEVPAGMLHKVTLAVTREGPYANPTLTAVTTPRPAWMQSRLGRNAIDRVWSQPDGSWIALAGDMVILVDRDHHPEIGLDFADLRTAAPSSGGVEIPDPGGDHAFVDRRLEIREVHRVTSSLVLLSTTDALPGDAKVLVAVDASTGEVVWQSRPNVAFNQLVIAGGHAIASTHVSGHWALSAIALDTGKIDASVPTKTGPYRLSVATDGSLYGVIDMAGDDGEGTKPFDLDATFSLDPP